MSELPRDPDTPLDLGDERDVKQLARTARQHDAIRATVLRNIMASIDGREWMHGLLGRCHVYGDLFSSDALVMAARVGERNVGIGLVQEIQANCAEQYLLMMKEAKDRADV